MTDFDVDAAAARLAELREALDGAGSDPKRPLVTERLVRDVMEGAAQALDVLRAETAEADRWQERAEAAEFTARERTAEYEQALDVIRAYTDGLQRLTEQNYDAGYSPEAYAAAVLFGHEPADLKARQARKRYEWETGNVHDLPDEGDEALD